MAARIESEKMPRRSQDGINEKDSKGKFEAGEVVDEKKREEGKEKEVQEMKKPRLMVRLRVKKMNDDIKYGDDESTVDEEGTFDNTLDEESTVDELNNRYNITTNTTTTITTDTNIDKNQVNYYGTFLYRPFKLFPLMVPGSRYRVLIPARYLHASINPAIRLNYFWRGADEGSFTDDSDLVCMLLLRLVNEERVMEEIGIGIGRNVLVQVEVLESNVLESCVLEPSVLESCSLKGNTSENTFKSKTNNLIPRNYSEPHDGHFIRITSFTVDPQTVHLRGWKKRRKEVMKRLRAGTITTPPFKTDS